MSNTMNELGSEISRKIVDLAIVRGLSRETVLEITDLVTWSVNEFSQRFIKELVGKEGGL